MGSSVNFVVAGFIEKMTSSDKDFRYMATNDLMNELKKETFKVDSQTEQRMVSGILKLLEDNNGEVQNLVVKCLPLMVNTISEKHLEDVVDTLCRHLSAGVEELRDVASIGLKSVIMEIPTNSSVVPNLCKRLTPKLLSSLQAEKTSYEVKMDSLDLLTELLSRFGTIMVPYHQEILGALIVTLSHARPAIRKRSSTALGHLVKHLNDKQFLMLVGEITAKLSSGQSTDMSRSYASCLATVSRSAGKRLSRALDSVSPILLALLGKADDELRESAFQALEYLVLQCQSEVSSLIPATLDKCLELIKYDPNYVDDDNEDEEMAADEDGEEESEGEYSDDDDMSWKVRRAASKTLAAIIFTRSEMLPDLLKKAGPVLVARFGEREENVRVENYNTFVVLLRKVGAANRRLPPAESQALRATLQGFVPKFCKAVAKSLRDKSQKTKQAGYSALKETVQVLNGGLDAEIAHFAQALTATLGSDGTSSALKIEILSFMGAFFRTHSAASFAPLLKSLVPQLVKATKEKFYKVASEALSACSELVQAIRPVVPAPSPVPAELLPYVGSVFAVATEIMTVQDVDQEVKERAIACFGNVISHAGDSLQAELDKALPLLMDKVSNEITRLVAVKTLVSIARSPLNINLAPFMEQIISELATFLRKANRSLRVSSLLCLNALVSSRGGQISEKQLELVVHEVKGLINDSDLQILPLSLTLLTSILKVKPACYSSLSSECLPAIFLLLRSPLLQGASLQALLELFETIVKENSGIFDQFLQKALEPAQAEDKLGLASSKQPFSSIAQSIGVFCRACPEKTTATSQKFIAMITKNGSDVERYLGLLTLGEIGKLNKMESDREVYETVLSFFLDNSEEVKSAAAFALGNIAVGDLGKFVPMILAEIQNQPKKQYLLLHSLKEVIAQEAQNQGAKNLLPFAEEIWSILIKNCESEEEGTRSAVAECLGKLAMTSPSKYLPALKEKLASDSALTRATCVMAVKFTFTIPSTECEGLFKALIQTIAPLSRDSNLTVRRVSLQALNSAAHNKPGVVRELLPMLLPILYEATQIEKDLIKLVTMGPFKYEVDEGLDARKAAYECLLTILSTCHDILNTFEFLERISQGLQDKFDIKILCHLALVHLCTLAPSAVQQKVDELLPALEGTINNKLKDTAVKQEIEKNEELVRSALRSVVALSKLPETEGNDRFSSFFKSLKASPHRAKLDSVITEMESRESTLDVMDTS